MQDLRTANSALAEELTRKQRETAALTAELASRREAAAAAGAALATGGTGDTAAASGDQRVLELQRRCAG
jgi:hypothetical protein